MANGGISGSRLRQHLVFFCHLTNVCASKEIPPKHKNNNKWDTQTPVKMLYPPTHRYNIVWKLRAENTHKRASTVIAFC